MRRAPAPGPDGRPGCRGWCWPGAGGPAGRPPAGRPRPARRRAAPPGTAPPATTDRRRTGRRRRAPGVTWCDRSDVADGPGGPPGRRPAGAGGGGGQGTDVGRNWSGNIPYSARRLHEPESMDELRRLVASSSRLRPLGTRHSFSTVADTTGDLVSVKRLPRWLEVDAGARTVTVSDGLRFGEIAPELDRAGWALGNLGSLPHISVAGACATGTHGSGVGNRVLAASAAAVEFVAADGDLVTLHRGDEGFEGAVVALGRLGVVTALTLDVRPRYEIRQVVHLGLPGDAAIEHVDDVLAGGYSVSLFTGWGDPLEFHV